LKKAKNYENREDSTTSNIPSYSFADNSKKLKN